MFLGSPSCTARAGGRDDEAGGRRGGGWTSSLERDERRRPRERRLSPCTPHPPRRLLETQATAPGGTDLVGPPLHRPVALAMDGRASAPWIRGSAGSGEKHRSDGGPSGWEQVQPGGRALRLPGAPPAGRSRAHRGTDRTPSWRRLAPRCLPAWSRRPSEGRQPEGGLCGCQRAGGGGGATRGAASPGAENVGRPIAHQKTVTRACAGLQTPVLLHLVGGPRSRGTRAQTRDGRAELSLPIPSRTLGRCV